MNMRDSSSPVKVISVTGGKGGIGKTNVAVNLAIALAKNYRVLLLDADLSLANVDVLLGLNANKNLSHVLNHQADLNDIIINGPHGVKIIPAATGLQNLADLSTMEHMGIIKAFDQLTATIDFLIIDTAAGISNSVLNFSQAAQEILVVVCNEPTSITDAYAFIKVMNQNYGAQRFRIVANMVSHYNEAWELFLKLNKAAERFLDVQLNFEGMIPYDPLVKKAIQQQTAVIQAFPSSHAALAIKKLGQAVAKWPLADYQSGHIGFFMEKLLNQGKALQESCL